MLARGDPRASLGFPGRPGASQRIILGFPELPRGFPEVSQRRIPGFPEVSQRCLRGGFQASQASQEVSQRRIKGTLVVAAARDVPDQNMGRLGHNPVKRCADLVIFVTFAGGINHFRGKNRARIAQIPLKSVIKGVLRVVPGPTNIPTPGKTVPGPTPALPGLKWSRLVPKVVKFTSFFVTFRHFWVTFGPVYPCIRRGSLNCHFCNDVARIRHFSSIILLYCRFIGSSWTQKVVLITRFTVGQELRKTESDQNTSPGNSLLVILVIPDESDDSGDS